MNESIKLSIPSNPKYISAVRLTTSAIANSLNFDIDCVEDLKVCISEACMNALGKDENINIIYEIYKDRLTILVSGVDEKISSEEKQELELGIMIIKSLMDQVDFCEKGIKMTKNIEEDIK